MRGNRRNLIIIVYLLMVILLARVIIWIEPAQLKKKMSEGLSENAEKLVIYIMQESNIKVSYIMRDDSNVMEKLADSVNRTSNVYSFVENSYSKENLVIYDPNTYKTTQIAVAEQTVTQEEHVVAEEKKEAETVQQEPAKEQENVVKETLAPAFSLEQLADFDFVKSNLYIVPERASVLPEDLDTKVLLEKDMSIVKDASVPQILIYHTHGSETFADSTEDIKGTGIIAVGGKLAEILSSVYGYNVIHCTEIFDNVNGVFDRSKAYDYSRETVQQILTDNPSVQVIIDLHRDGVREDLHLVTDINGKPTARIMFFNGVSRSSAQGDISYLYNQYRSDNLSFSLQAKLEALCKYPDFTRKNYIDAYQYNLDLMPRAMLIEAGAQTNTLQEELNAMEPLADILDSVLSGESREHLGLDSN
ncbi:MAG: stage II sporulation protein P [Lachnospiraceae bacterium]|nr:stage II sporulation protein P [Lachnospiraceae bacterium]